MVVASNEGPRIQSYLANGLVHHCCSQGVPSLFPSIFVPGQLWMNHFASVQEVICEQWILPSQRKPAVVPCSVPVADEVGDWSDSALRF
jgi:hypothetical protein